MMYILKYIFLVVFTVVIACSPERDNPLDPKSPHYTGEATLKGTVGNFVGNPIENASVSAYSIDSQYFVSTFTDGDGRFTLSINKGSYDVIATKDGYTECCEEIAINAGEEKEVLFHINGIPFFVQQMATSGRMATWMGSIVEIVVSAQVDDPDGTQDIDSVSVVISDIEKKMDFNPLTQVYECRISENECPNGNPELLIGKPFIATAVDEKQAENTSSEFYLARIFSEFPISIYPQDGDTVSAVGLQLLWHKLRITYPISYLAQIFVGWPPQVLWEESTQDTISSVDITLSEGEYYYWIVTEDEYGNTARSIAKRFWID